MLRPSPVPWPSGLVVKNGSKIRSRTVGSMPVPRVVDVDRDAVAVGGRLGPDGDAAAGRAGVDRVGQQVHHHLVDLGRVAGHQRQRARGPCRSSTRLLQGPAADDVDGRLDAGVEVDRL